MSLKDKAKGIWKKVTDLDDESINSASKDKGRIPYKDISKKLKEIMKQNVDVVGRKIIIPCYYIIYFNESDRKMRIEVENIVSEELKEELFHDMRKINPEMNKRELFIAIATDAELSEGQFRIEQHIKKPEIENKIIENDIPIQEPNFDNESDFQQTVIEQAIPDLIDEESTVIMQKSSSNIVYKLLVDSGTDKQELEITKNIILIGRGNIDDVKLHSTDFSISRSHISISVKDNNYFLIPSGINGTLLNGQELELNKEVRITVEDEIKIMNYSLRILKS